MEVTLISYEELLNPKTEIIRQKIQNALFNEGIIGVKDVPDFLKKTSAYIDAAKEFAALSLSTKQKYAPKRDDGVTEGYELGAEKFQDKNGNWKIDDKKASFYAFVPDRLQNKWPAEVNLKMPYLELGELIFTTGKYILNFLGINNNAGINHDGLVGYGRMLHYQKENDTHDDNPNWCGAHFDHGIFTGLVPAYYFKDGKEVAEPEEAGLFILPTNSSHFIKINSLDKSILFFQVGEFAQLATHDTICATQHLVKKAKENIERFTFALFFSPSGETIIHSKSKLAKDRRYIENMCSDGSINFAKWNAASFAKYHAQG